MHAQELPASALRRANLARTLHPRSIAIVGLSDSSRYVDFIAPTLKSDAEIFFVNPNHATVLGHATHPSLTSLGRPIDVVLSTMASERTVALAREAAELDCGGVVMIAGGFAEVSKAGAAMQEELREIGAASEMAIIGPNGLGYINVPRSISLTIASDHKRRVGGISVVAQTGAMLSGVVFAAWDRRHVGLNLLISAGNEAATDLADYVDYLAEDPLTTSIGLIVEKIRRPQAFFAAVDKARAAGKPIVALKLGRSARSQEIALAHTAAQIEDAWVYDVALHQAGISIARDPEELVDRLSLLEQIDPGHWTGAENVGVVTQSGGFSSLAVDVALEEGIHLPALPEFRPWLDENLPGITVPNPLDMTGLGGQFWPDITWMYGGSDAIDALLFIHPLADEDDTFTADKIDQFVEVARSQRKPFIIANCSGVLGQYVIDRGTGIPNVGFGFGLRATMRGLDAMGRFVRRASRPPAAVPSPRLAPPPAIQTIIVRGEAVPTWTSIAQVLTHYGVDVAPFTVVTAASAHSLQPEFAGPFVVRLCYGEEHERQPIRAADDEQLAESITRLTVEADRLGLPPHVLVQQSWHSREAVVTRLLPSTELGAMVTLEAPTADSGDAPGYGLLAPFDEGSAQALLDDVREPWRQYLGTGGALARHLTALGSVAAQADGLIGALRLRHVVGADGTPVVVDAAAELKC